MPYVVRELGPPPNVKLGRWLRDYYDFVDIPTEDISWFHWWNDDWDITVDFEELNSPITAATIDSSIDLLESIVRIHIFVRDTMVHSDSSPLGEMIAMPFTDTDFEINVPNKLIQLVAYFEDKIDRNANTLRSENINDMVVDDSLEIPNQNWDQNVYHWVIQVRVTYTEWSGNT